MQKQNTANIIRHVRIIPAILFVLVSTATLLSFRTSVMLDNFWQQLGISKQDGTANIQQSFLGGYLQHYGANKIKNLAAGDRAAVAKDLMTYTKEYINSPTFHQAYQKVRSQSKPILNERKVRSKDEIRRERIAETEKSIRETEQNLKTMKPDMAKAIAPVLDVLKEQLKEYKNPNSQMIEYMHQGEVMNAQSEERSYQESLKRWEKEYPADPNVLIKKRLEHFIAVANTVDFTAELKTANGKKKFVKAEYEGKSDEWKQMYRAGKDVILPAVSFAKQWLSELK